MDCSSVTLRLRADYTTQISRYLVALLHDATIFEWYPGQVLSRTILPSACEHIMLTEGSDARQRYD